MKRLVFLMGVVFGVVWFYSAVASGGGNHDVCERKPWKPECQTTTTLPPETTTTTVPETTTTTVPETTTTTVAAPVVEVDYRQECPSPDAPSGALVVELSGTAGTEVTVQGVPYTIPTDVVFDLPAEGFVWTVYVDWDGGTRVLTDVAPVCNTDHETTTTSVAPDAPISPQVGGTLPNTGNRDWIIWLGVGLLAVGVPLWLVRAVTRGRA